MTSSEKIHVSPTPARLPIQDLFLDSENPRHKPVLDEPEAIKLLCDAEKVYELAADIAEIGLNPLERFAVIPVDPAHTEGPFVVVEGNRRLCALKLLADPESAPADQVARFRALSPASAIIEVDAMIFADKASARVWLERQHSGEFDGKGRKPWNSEQKARFLGGGRHGRAQRLLDLAQEKGWISEEERAGKLSVVDRWISNPVFREFLGIEFKRDSDELLRVRPPADFDYYLKLFIDLVKLGDAKDGISTRAKAEDMKRKARELEEKLRPDVSSGKIDGRRIDAEPVIEPEPPEDLIEPPSPGPKKPRYPRLPHSLRIEADLLELGVQKLQKLYHALVKVPLEHTPLLAVGAWSFLEGLTANAGRLSTSRPASFDAFLSSQKLSDLGFTNKDVRKGIEKAVAHIADYGNMTKHDAKAAQLNGEQLYNDLETIEELILALIKESKNLKTIRS